MCCCCWVRVSDRAFDLALKEFILPDDDVNVITVFDFEPISALDLNNYGAVGTLAEVASYRSICRSLTLSFTLFHSFCLSCSFGW